MKYKLLTPILLGAILFIGVAFGQDASFTYQGILKHDGVAAYGTYDFEFRLYQFDTGGTPLGPANLRSAVIVSNGLFTVVLDFGGVFNADSRWLQIGVKTNASSDPYAILTPRQELTPTPHAVYAHNAARADAVPWSGLESLPGGFADGVDNDTTYTAGVGLTLSGTTFSLHQAFTDALYWRLGGNNLGPGQFLGTTNNQPLELRAFHVRALRLEPAGGLPNVIGGSSANSVTPEVVAATIGGGHRNLIETNSSYATIGGGSNNIAAARAAFIGGGIANEAQGTNSTVSGGAFNKVFRQYGTVGGGLGNWSREEGDTIAGGRGNTAEGADSTVAGGFANRASGYISAVGGGQGNRARGANSVIAGGASNDIWDFADHSAIGGGVGNEVGGRTEYGTITGGLLNVASNAFATVGGGATNRALAYGSVIAGGTQNSARATNATIAGGHRNIAWSEYSTIGGGLRNEVVYGFATVSGGASNSASAVGAVIAGGVNHTAEGPYSTIGGGHSNRIDTGFLADGRGATIGGGAFNYISEWGLHGTIPGGYSNVVLFPGGYAAGHRAKANHTGSFVWADRTDSDFASTAENQFAIRARAGLMIQGSDTALDLRGGGAVRVEGAGVGSSTPVFIHRATAANTAGHVTTIDHPHSNGQPNAILIVTPNFNPGGAGGTYNTSAIGVYYTAGKWTIFNQITTTPITIGAAFNVMVVKP
jgi:hypothetical protein